MAHIPTQEADIQKVYRIAEQLGIGLEEAVVTYAGFDMAFSDESTRRQIFGMIDQLDESAARKGEPLGLIINYAVELSRDGIRVGRYADEIPPGEVVHHVPTDRARIMLRVKDDFPTQEFLGPLIVHRPSWSEPGAARDSQMGIPDGVQDATGDISEDRRSQIEDRKSIYLGPIRFIFRERFPFLSAGASRSQRVSFPSSAGRTALDPPGCLPPLAASTPAFQSTSGLSPPSRSEN